jgi:2-polyprenyl-3-methyl-5-hydroxy-6-metoxy-1,4-benzoquinol methylase
VSSSVSFYSYRRTFVQAIRRILARGRSDVLSEAAFPAYANRNPLAAFLFWSRVRVVMRHLAGRRRFRTVVDFGCGGGVMLPFLATIADEVVGLDTDMTPHQMLSAEISFASNITVVNRALTDFAPQSCDVCLALDVLEHVADLEGCVAAIGELLNQDGRLIVSGPTENRWYRLGRRFSGPEYTGAYHVRSIYDIRAVLDKYFEVDLLATLWAPIELFHVYECIPRRR